MTYVTKIIGIVIILVFILLILLGHISKENKMKKKLFCYLSLAVLLNSLIFTPLIKVWAEEQKETVEQYSNDDLQNTENENVRVKTTDSLSDTSDTMDSPEENEESITSTSGSTLEMSGSSMFEGRIQPETSSSSEGDDLKSVLVVEEDLSSWLPDPILQSVVANSLGILVSEITKEKIRQLETLYIYSSDTNIADLTGLEYATNLSSFYMSGTNQITDFSVLTTFEKLVYVYLMGANVTDDNVPNFGDTVTRLDLTDASVTDAVYSKIVNMKGLESLRFESNMNITTIAPLAVLPNLREVRIQTCGVSDFTVINEFPKLESLAAYGQNIGRKDDPTSILAKDLTYDQENQSFFVPFSLMPNRLTNFDGYVPPFTLSNSPSQTYLDLNGIQLSSSQINITEEGITVTGITQSEFDNIKTMKYNSRLNNPVGSYAHPEGFNFYAISSGTYLHKFTVDHQEVAADVTVSYIDTDGNELKPSQKISGNIGESFDATTPEYKLEIDGYTLKDVQGNATGTFSDTAQEVVYVYERSDAAPVTVRYQDSEGNQLAEPTVLSGKVGLPYTSEAKEIPGWYLVEIPTNVSGIFSEDPQEVRYIYDIQDNEETDPENTTPDPEEETDLDSNDKDQEKDNSENNTPEPEGNYDSDNDSAGEDEGTVFTNSSPESERDPDKGSSEVDTDATGNLPNTGETLHGQKIMIGLGVLLVFFSLIIIGESRKRKYTK